MSEKFWWRVRIHLRHSFRTEKQLFPLQMIKHITIKEYSAIRRNFKQTQYYQKKTISNKNFGFKSSTANEAKAIISVNIPTPRKKTGK